MPDCCGEQGAYWNNSGSRDCGLGHPGGGGGGALRYRGGPHPRYVFCGRRGLF